MPEYHILNLGAGKQSTFLYLAFAQRLFPDLPKLDCAIFADTLWEPAAVYSHLKWLQSLKDSPPIHVVSKGSLGDHLRRGTNSTGGRFASIPAFTTDGETIGITRRQCSRDYKIEVIRQSIRTLVLGVRRVPKGVVIHQYFGISLDESGRAVRIARAPRPKYLRMHFPLVEKFITRAECDSWLRKHVPHEVPRSACVFCPYHSDDEWLQIQSVKSDWKRAVEIDEALRTTGAVANRKMDQTMYVHRSCQPLVQIKFKPSADPRAAQSNISFAPECMGVCGV